MPPLLRRPLHLPQHASLRLAAALPRLADAVSKEPSCDGAYVETSRRAIALGVLGAGQKADGSFTPDAVAAAAVIARPWQVSLAFGQAARRLAEGP